MFRRGKDVEETCLPGNSEGRIRGTDAPFVSKIEEKNLNKPVHKGVVSIKRKNQPEGVRKNADGHASGRVGLGIS